MRELRAERKRRGIRLIDLQEAVGYHRTAIGAWERGKYSPPLVALADLCEAMGVELKIELARGVNSSRRGLAPPPLALS